MDESNCSELWKDSLRIISSKLKRTSFDTWFSRTVGVDLDDEVLYVQTPNDFISEWLKEHYLTVITESVESIAGRKLKINFHSNPESNKKIPEKRVYVIPAADKSKDELRRYSQVSNLSSRYTFDNFVVGESNQFAHAAAMSVAESFGRSRYNPLYIYGSSGLGKTHLAQAIGNFVNELYPRVKTLYVTSEKFTNDFINSITSSSTNDFVRFYRNADLLLLDDIQFFTGKESTQVQFFHTFNVLYQTNKQIVLTSDRSPKEIQGLEERLLSRFSWGLVTDIQPPDLETRIAIIRKKCEADSVNLPDDVITFVAEHITNNVRELEGCIIRMLAYSSFRDVPITMDLAAEILRDTISETHKTLTINEIKREVAKSFGIPIETLSAKKKTKEIALARMTAMYLSRKLTESSLKAIGVEFGGRDHTTVIHAVNQVDRHCEADMEYKRRLDDIITKLYG